MTTPTASLLPPPRTVVYDANGNPVVGGFVNTYVPGGTTPKQTWQDPDQNILNSNPVILDAAGSCLLYGNGDYQLTVTDSLGNAVPAYSGGSQDPLSLISSMSLPLTGGTLTGPLVIGTTLVPEPLTVTGSLVVGGAALPAIIRGYIGGLTLSNDAGSPNTVLDISAGTCSDSTSAVTINLGAFTKSTAGAWAAGSGANGMGTGLTIAPSTWYHVFAIVNGSVPDVYFDTSVTAANAPTGTTTHRRIGSFLTDGSSHIVAFFQNGDQFIWSTPVSILTSQTAGTTSAQTISMAAGVPIGVVVAAALAFNLINSGNAPTVYYSALVSADLAPSGTAFTGTAGVDQVSAGQISVTTNTAASLRVRNFNATDVNTLLALGWLDARGRSA